MKPSKARELLPAKFTPMLAYNKDYDLSKIKYPVYVQRKYNGIRCMIIAGHPFTRSWQPIENTFVNKMIRELYSRCGSWYIDCELSLFGPDDGKEDFHENESFFSTRITDSRKFYTYMFDSLQLGTPGMLVTPYYVRDDNVQTLNASYIKMHELCSTQSIERVLIHNAGQLEDYAESNQHWEGLVIRSTHGRYKMGRSTFNEGYMLKYVPWHYAEGSVCGVKEEREQMAYASTRGLDGKGRAGSVQVTCPDLCKDKFYVSGLTDELKAWFWENRERMSPDDCRIRFRYKRLGKTRPLSPQFVEVNTPF